MSAVVLAAVMGVLVIVYLLAVLVMIRAVVWLFKVLAGRSTPGPGWAVPRDYPGHRTPPARHWRSR
jgi:uncharacterized membrane protein HdeD (DUF308 family)